MKKARYTERVRKYCCEHDVVYCCEQSYPGQVSFENLGTGERLREGVERARRRVGR